MDRFSIILNKKPPSKPKKRKIKKSKFTKVTKTWTKFAKINKIESEKEWIKAFNSMIDPK